jgi:hypothetical protein
MLPVLTALARPSRKRSIGNNARIGNRKRNKKSEFKIKAQLQGFHAMTSIFRRQQTGMETMQLGLCCFII